MNKNAIIEKMKMSFSDSLYSEMIHGEGSCIPEDCENLPVYACGTDCPSGCLSGCSSGSCHGGCMSGCSSGRKASCCTDACR